MSADMYEFYKAAAMKTESTLRQNFKAELIIAINSSDSISKPFIEKLDKVLQGVSGFDRVTIDALDYVGNASTIKSMGIPIPGLMLLRNGKTVDTMNGSGATVSSISKFITNNRKFWAS